MAVPVSGVPVAGVEVLVDGVEVGADVDDGALDVLLGAAEELAWVVAVSITARTIPFRKSCANFSSHKTKAAPLGNGSVYESYTQEQSYCGGGGGP